MFFWLIRGHAAEGLRWYEQILRLSVPPDVTSRSLLGAAVMLYVQGQHAPAREGLDRAMTIALDAGDEEVIAQTEHLLGHIEYAVGNMDAARRQFTSCVPRFRALSIPWGTSSALSGMAEVALAMGNYDEAERQLDDAEPALRDAGPWFRALGLYVRAVVAVRRGLPDEALALVRESLTQIRNLQDKFAFVYSLVPLAAAASLKGDDAWVARILGARDAVTDRTGSAISDGSGTRPARADRTTGAYAPGPGALGPGVRGRPPDLHRRLAERHRSHPRLVFPDRSAGFHATEYSRPPTDY